MEKPVVKVVLTQDAALPTYAKDGDAGADIRAIPNSNTNLNYVGLGHLVDEKFEPTSCDVGDYVIPPGHTAMIKTGIRIELEPGWEMQVRSRSGLAKRGLVVANSPGTIDSGYRGPCMVMLHNNTSLIRVIKPGTRIAQFVLKRAPQADFQLVNELSDSERGEGGFGSTGTQ
jgi:dUTP pyrophosphatase